MSVGCADYLVGIGFEHWARAHFVGIMYNLMTSNITESLNAALGESSGFPIVPLMDYIRGSLWDGSPKEGTRRTMKKVL